MRNDILRKTVSRFETDEEIVERFASLCKLFLENRH